ncbi:MAG: acetyl-CoA carboxylase biotin carboxylase subunit [Bacillota bacterium]
MKKVLVANRGEIAVRVIRACKELGIKTVGVYSEADKESLHVQMADQSVCIGPPLTTKSYLNINTLLSVALLTKADAIHPGYGFLAENAEFSDVCRRNNIRFVGPTGNVIRKMGNKIAARKAAAAAGVPVVPGTKENISDLDEIVRVANNVGFPVLLKAAAGGGGRGMQLVHNEQEVREAFMRTQAEAQVAFGDRSLYVEKYIRNARHVEVQVLFDEHGNGIHLGERDCSLQRRHQKLLEESPCTVIDDNLRNELTNAALVFARSVGYTSAGTVEFVVDLDEKKFYFIEMNTRIQVEHPVTEILTGVDIIKEQLRVAAGEKLSISQDDVKSRGHAIECRINAEDVAKGFVPIPGKIESIAFPAGPGVRVDSHTYTGYKISPFYDSLIAKLIVVDSNRQNAIERMLRALDEFKVAGIPTTVPFHQKILQNPSFAKGEYNTRWVEEVFLNDQAKD